jgi:hypothetical protein
VKDFKLVSLIECQQRDEKISPTPTFSQGKVISPYRKEEERIGVNVSTMSPVSIYCTPSPLRYALT